MQDQDRYAAIELGVPGRCALCRGLGYVDHIDFDSRSQVQHCTDCGHRWQYHFDPRGRVTSVHELDSQGHAVVVTHVRGDADAADSDATVIDLRERSAPRRPAAEMTPGEWLRHTAGHV